MINQKDIGDLKLARPVSILDLWEIDERIARLENVACRLEKVLEAFILLYHEERVKTWEIMLKKMMEKHEKKGNRNESSFRRR